MTDAFKVGTVLFEEGTLLPDCLQLENESCSNGWRAVRNLGSCGRDRKIRAAGWTFFFLAGEVKASVFGFDAERTTLRAIKRVLANPKSEKFNCLEITQVALKRFLGVPYVSVSAHWRHIQESMFLCRAQRLAEWDRAKLTRARAET